MIRALDRTIGGIKYTIAVQPEDVVDTSGVRIHWHWFIFDGQRRVADQKYHRTYGEAYGAAKAVLDKIEETAV